jgi:hypothetical protein
MMTTSAKLIEYAPARTRNGCGNQHEHGHWSQPHEPANHHHRESVHTIEELNDDTPPFTIDHRCRGRENTNSDNQGKQVATTLCS